MPENDWFDEHYVQDPDSPYGQDTVSLAPPPSTYVQEYQVGDRVAHSVATVSAAAETNYSDPVAASVRAESAVTISTTHPTGFAYPAAGFAEAILSYNFDIVGSAPVSISDIPLTYALQTGGSADVWEPPTYWASAFQLFLGPDPFWDIELYFGSDGPTGPAGIVDVTDSVLFDYGSGPAKVILKAFCEAYATSRTYEANCDAFMDPVFSFDQTAFDAMMGQDTFILEDYFDIVYTPVPQTSQIPVPPAFPMFATALCLVGITVRRQRNRG